MRQLLKCFLIIWWKCLEKGLTKKGVQEDSDGTKHKSSKKVIKGKSKRKSWTSVRKRVVSIKEISKIHKRKGKR